MTAGDEMGDAVVASVVQLARRNVCYGLSTGFEIWWREVYEDAVDQHPMIEGEVGRVHVIVACGRATDVYLMDGVERGRNGRRRRTLETDEWSRSVRMCVHGLLQKWQWVKEEAGHDKAASGRREEKSGAF